MKNQFKFDQDRKQLDNPLIRDRLREVDLMLRVTSTEFDKPSVETMMSTTMHALMGLNPLGRRVEAGFGKLLEF